MGRAAAPALRQAASRQREIRRRTGLSRNTIRRALDSERAAGLSRARRRGRSSSRSRTRSTGCCARTRSCRGPGPRAARAAGLHARPRRSSMTTCARSGRCSRRRRRTFQRTVYRPGRDLPVRCLAAARGGPGRSRPDPPRLGRDRVLGLLARRRRRAGVLASRPRTCWPGSPAAWSAWAALPRTLVWDRQAGIHGHGGRPTRGVRRVLRPAEGRLAVLRAGRSAGQGRVERLQGYAETNFEPGRAFANELDFQDQLDAWFAKVNARTHKTLRARPIDRLADELEAMAPLPERDARHAPGAG